MTESPPRLGLWGLPTAVWALGVVSLLTDAASDMVYPLLPKLLATLGGGAMALGVMEGIAEALASFVKVWAGRASDRGGKRGPFVVVGYGVAALARPCMAIVSAPWQVIVARSFDRAGKGMRSAPRDAIIGRVTPKEKRGLAFGVHRMMDNLGAVFGPLFAFLLLTQAKVTLRTVFALAIIPGLISTAVAFVTVRREPAADVEPMPRGSDDGGELPKRVRALLIAVALFALSASADSFLMARLLDLGMDLGIVPIAWVTLQLGKALLNAPGGALADRMGPRRVLVASWAIYAIAYGAFALAPSWRIFWALFPLYALHYGLGEGAEKSLMARLCPEHRRGAAFGAQHAVHGFALLPANFFFGWLYTRHAWWAFAASAVLAAAATVALIALTSEHDVDAVLTSA